MKSKTDTFIQMALCVDADVATMVSRSREEFYQTNPWLRPSTPTSAWDKIWEKICDTAGDTISKCWNGIIEFYSSNKSTTKIMDAKQVVNIKTKYASPPVFQVKELKNSTTIEKIYEILGEDIYYWGEYLELIDIWVEE